MDNADYVMSRDGTTWAENRNQEIGVNLSALVDKQSKKRNRKKKKEHTANIVALRTCVHCAEK